MSAQTKAAAFYLTMARWCRAEGKKDSSFYLTMARWCRAEGKKDSRPSETAKLYARAERHQLESEILLARERLHLPGYPAARTSGKGTL